jgi:hypothetical protein
MHVDAANVVGQPVVWGVREAARVPTVEAVCRVPLPKPGEDFNELQMCRRD